MAPSSPHFLCWVALTSVEWRKPEQGSQAFHREIVGTFFALSDSNTSSHRVRRCYLRVSMAFAPIQVANTDSVWF